MTSENYIFPTTDLARYKFLTHINDPATDCFGSIRNEDEPTWESYVKVLCEEQGWAFNTVKIK